MIVENGDICDFVLQHPVLILPKLRAGPIHSKTYIDAWGMQEYRSVGRSLFTVFVAAIATFEPETYINTHNPAITAGLFIVFQFVMGFILLNLLIALMTNAHEKVRPFSTCCCAGILGSVVEDKT